MLILDGIAILKFGIDNRLAFGNRHRILVSMLFSLELTATCVALVVLFADSLHALVPDVSTTAWKLMSLVVFIPLSFVSLNILSYTSILGILGTIGRMTISEVYADVKLYLSPWQTA